MHGRRGVRRTTFAGCAVALAILGSLWVLSYWRAAWILAATADTDFPPPPGIGAALSEDAVLDAIPIRVYRPDDGGRHPTLIFAHSFTPSAETDERLARSLVPLARAGIVAIVPRLSFVSRDEVDQGDIATLVATFRASPALPYVSAGDRGLGGYSWSAGYALLAAADERIRADVRLVLSIGGYAAADSLLHELVTHRIVEGDGTVREWSPEPWAELVAKGELARRGYLSPARLAAEMARLSPIAHAAEVRAPVVLMHGLDDPLVPEEETLRLGRALSAGTTVVAFETPLLHHVNFQDLRGSISAEGLDAVWQMVRAIRWALERL